MSDLTTHTYAVTIGGKEYPYALNMGVLDDVIAENGYSGENDEGDYADAFIAAERGDNKAMRLVIWAGMLAAFMDERGVIDFKAAPPITVLNLATAGEMNAARDVASDAYVTTVMRVTPEMIAEAKAAAEKEAKRAAAAEAAGRPTKAPRKR